MQSLLTLNFNTEPHCRRVPRAACVTNTQAITGTLWTTMRNQNWFGFDHTEEAHEVLLSSSSLFSPSDIYLEFLLAWKRAASGELHPSLLSYTHGILCERFPRVCLWLFAGRCWHSGELRIWQVCSNRHKSASRRDPQPYTGRTVYHPGWNDNFHTMAWRAGTKWTFSNGISRLFTSSFSGTNSGSLQQLRWTLLQ